jgi:rhodanese-related sulfurtransferase/ABC-type phosphate/phosphonate transport system substrate-binding protein
MLLLVGAVHAQTRVLINPGDQGEQNRFEIFSQWKSTLDQAVRKAGGVGVSVQLSTDATQDLQNTRSRTHDIYVAPAHVVGSAMRYGYTPALGLDQPVQAVLAVPEGSKIKSLADAKGHRLGLPQQDSVVTYLLRGEVNAINTSIKRHFGPQFQTRYQDALLPCLQIRRCDVVVVEKAVYERWLAAGEKLRVVMETRSSPGLSVAVKDGSKPDAQAVRAALAEVLAAAAPSGKLGTKTVSLTRDDFQYVSTLGYFTPRSLAGAQVVDAADVKRLVDKGAKVIDTRNEAEYRAGHIPGAELVPYVEKSAKDADYDSGMDQFDLARLGTDRSAELIFACNGPECWKSFKASQTAIKAGFSRVYWFRGGLPEWRTDGQKIATES